MSFGKLLFLLSDVNFYSIFKSKIMQNLLLCFMIYWKIWWKFGFTLQIQISSSKAPLMELISTGNHMILSAIWNK